MAAFSSQRLQQRCRGRFVLTAQVGQDKPGRCARKGFISHVIFSHAWFYTKLGSCAQHTGIPVWPADEKHQFEYSENKEQPKQMVVQVRGHTIGHVCAQQYVGKSQ